jgi:hypothetical protein
MELAIGNEVILTNDDGGILAGVVDRFERDGNVAVIMPSDPVMQVWYRNGYQLGRAHWDAKLTPILHRTEQAPGNRA